LARGLEERGDAQIVVIDNLLTGHKKNLDGLAQKVEFHHFDIRNYDAIAPVIAGADTVFHLAAIPSVPKSIADPVPSHDVNINGTFTVLRAARDGGARRVVYAASSSAYGDTDVLPKVESMKTMPKSPYALQKLVGEHYCNIFTNCFGLETIALRFFNVYGPRQDPESPYSGVLSLFMKHLIARTAPTIHGDGEQTRDFTYVEDVADLVIKASTAGVSGTTYNAGNGGRYSLNQVWRILEKIEGIDIKPHYGPGRPGDVRDSQADTAAAVRDLGHSPRFTIEEGLLRTLDWYKKS
jgi:UDP-glucose 4-epimerase